MIQFDSSQRRNFICVESKQALPICSISELNWASGSLCGSQNASGLMTHRWAHSSVSIGRRAEPNRRSNRFRLSGVLPK